MPLSRHGTQEGDRRIGEEGKNVIHFFPSGPFGPSLSQPPPLFVLLSVAKKPTARSVTQARVRLLCGRGNRALQLPKRWLINTILLLTFYAPVWAATLTLEDGQSRLTFDSAALLARPDATEVEISADDVYRHSRRSRRSGANARCWWPSWIGSRVTWRLLRA